MNSRLKIGTLLVALSTLWMAVWADAPLKSYKDISSPERNARLITEAMQSRLGLTEKQYKKVYKIQLAEQKTIFKYKPTPQRGIEKDLGEMPLQGHRMEGGRPHRGGGFEEGDPKVKDFKGTSFFVWITPDGHNERMNA